MLIIPPRKRLIVAPPFIRSIDDQRAQASLGLAGHWSMGAETINGARLLDLSGNDNHGTLAGSPPIVAGPTTGKALSFNGTTQQITIAPTRAIVNNFSVALWANPSASGATQVVFSTRHPGNDATFDIQLNSGTTIHGDIGDGTIFAQVSANAAFTLTPGIWVHVVYVVSTTTYTIYANGVQVGSGATNTSAPVLYGNYGGTHEVRIGNYDLVSNIGFPGLVGPVRLYDRALPAAEVFTQYTRSFDAFQTRGRVGVVSSGALALAPGAGSAVITGQIPGMTLGTTLAPGAGSAVITGQTPGMTLGTTLAPGAGSAVITGQTPGMTLGATLAPGAGSTVITGQTPGLTIANTLAPGAGSAIITGQTPGLALGTTLAPGAGSIVFTGQTPGLGGSVTLAPGPGSAVITGQLPGMAIGATLSPGFGAIIVTGQTPGLSLGLTLAPGAGSVVFTGRTPGITSAGTTLSPGPGSIVMLGGAVEVTGIVAVTLAATFRLNRPGEQLRIPAPPVNFTLR